MGSTAIDMDHLIREFRPNPWNIRNMFQKRGLEWSLCRGGSLQVELLEWDGPLEVTFEAEGSNRIAKKGNVISLSLLRGSKIITVLHRKKEKGSTENGLFKSNAGSWMTNTYQHCDVDSVEGIISKCEGYVCFKTEHYGTWFLLEP